ADPRRASRGHDGRGHRGDRRVGRGDRAPHVASRTSMSLDDFPRHPLLFGPSPVHRLERLSRHLGGAALWAKREDCNSGLAYGGNKTRKLEYLVAAALAEGCDTLVSIGGVQSNHTRQVAAVAAKLSLGCVLCRSAGSSGRMPSKTRSATSCSPG